MPTNTADRTAKFMTILSSGDDTIDVISADQEMLLPVVNAGYLEPLDDVLTDEVKAAYPESFIEMSDGKGVPMFMEIFCFWLNSKYVKEAGMDSIQTKDEFVEFLEKYPRTMCMDMAEDGNRHMSGMISVNLLIYLVVIYMTGLIHRLRRQ